MFRLTVSYSVNCVELDCGYIECRVYIFPLKMAPRRRRTTRLSKADLSPEPRSDSPVHVEEPNEELSHSGNDSCPACNADESPLNAEQKESWVRCDACKNWYHWVCAGNGGDLEAIDKWYGQLLSVPRSHS